MSFADKVQKDLVDAMRAKEELRLSVLRGIKAAIKHKEVERFAFSTRLSPFRFCKRS